METFTSKSGKVFVFVGEDGCNCNKCIFNQMGAEGNALCREAPDCDGEGYYVLKSEVK